MTKQCLCSDLHCRHKPRSSDLRVRMVQALYPRRIEPHQSFRNPVLTTGARLKPLSRLSPMFPLLCQLHPTILFASYKVSVPASYSYRVCLLNCEPHFVDIALCWEKFKLLPALSYEYKHGQARVWCKWMGKSYKQS